jgi:hypothetical protein
VRRVLLHVFNAGPGDATCKLELPAETRHFACFLACLARGDGGTTKRQIRQNLMI